MQVSLPQVLNTGNISSVISPQFIIDVTSKDHYECLKIPFPPGIVTHIESPYIGLLPSIFYFWVRKMRTAEEAQICADFGQHLAKLRKEMGWSQEKLSLESGIARSYIGDVERGIRNIALVNICRIADTMGIARPELMKF